MSKVKVIVTGHGLFASGIKGALELLAKIPDNWFFIDFSEGMSDTDLEKQYTKIINFDQDQVLFFTDLAGGTPYKVSATLSTKSTGISVVSGGNLSSLLETLFTDYDNAAEYAQDIIKISKKGTQVFSLDNIKSINKNQDIESDGI
ncbi:PTS sugar transporter subunit IIA [Lactobacillus sp. ESL0701]|uniref:PTS sugar transporter subunit IIA domain-containing protein n=1 Tax=Lactobacillus sp. ESL0701 TaxID=2983217 RepID=UPI0023F954E2|nr:PTS sugar transporter subunit IIA [Lactobacillus sp. ESL0701]